MSINQLIYSSENDYPANWSNLIAKSLILENLITKEINVENFNLTQITSENINNSDTITTDNLVANNINLNNDLTVVNLNADTVNANNINLNNNLDLNNLTASNITVDDLVINNSLTVPNFNLNSTLSLETLLCDNIINSANIQTSTLNCTDTINSNNISNSGFINTVAVNAETAVLGIINNVNFNTGIILASDILTNIINAQSITTENATILNNLNNIQKITTNDFETVTGNISGTLTVNNLISNSKLFTNDIENTGNITTDSLTVNNMIINNATNLQNINCTTLNASGVINSASSITTPYLTTTNILNDDILRSQIVELIDGIYFGLPFNNNNFLKKYLFYVYDTITSVIGLLTNSEAHCAFQQIGYACQFSMYPNNINNYFGIINNVLGNITINWGNFGNNILNILKTTINNNIMSSASIRIYDTVNNQYSLAVLFIDRQNENFVIRTQNNTPFLNMVFYSIDINYTSVFF